MALPQNIHKARARPQQRHIGASFGGAANGPLYAICILHPAREMKHKYKAKLGWATNTRQVVKIEGNALEKEEKDSEPTCAE